MEKAERFTLPFRWKLSLIIISVCAVSLLAALGSYYAFDVIRFHNEIVARIEATQQLLMESLVASLEKDPTATDLALDKLRSDNLIVAAAVYSTSNRLLCKYIKGGANEFIPLPKVVNLNISTNEVTMFRPILNKEGRKLGTLYM